LVANLRAEHTLVGGFSRAAEEVAPETPLVRREIALYYALSDVACRCPQRERRLHLPADPVDLCHGFGVPVHIELDSVVGQHRRYANLAIAHPQQLLAIPLDEALSRFLALEHECHQHYPERCQNVGLGFSPVPLALRDLFPRYVSIDVPDGYTRKEERGYVGLLGGTEALIPLLQVRIRHGLLVRFARERHRGSLVLCEVQKFFVRHIRECSQVVSPP
jgi:hypothetical protein